MNSVYDALSPQQRIDLLLVYHILQLTGGVGIGMVLLTTAFAKSLKPRHPLAINMMFCWFIYALVSSLLLISGYSSRLDVPFELCLVDAALINAVTVLASVSCSALVIHLWVVVQSCVLPEGKLKAFLDAKHRGITQFFLFLPYIFFILWAVFMLIIGLCYPMSVSKRRAWFYCTLDPTMNKLMGPIGNTTTFVAGVMVLVTVLFELLIVNSIWKHKIPMHSLDKRGLDKCLILRIGVFSTFTVCMVIAVLFTLFLPTQVARHIFLSTVPLANFLVFGPQRDLLACWLAWIPRRSAPKWLVPTPYIDKGSISRPKEMASRPGPQCPSPATATGTESTDSQAWEDESRSSISPASYGSAADPPPKSLTALILQTGIPEAGEQLPPYPASGHSEPETGAVQVPPSAHLPRTREIHGVPPVAIPRPLTRLIPPRITIQPPSLPVPSMLRGVSDSS